MIQVWKMCFSLSCLPPCIRECKNHGHSFHGHKFISIVLIFIFFNFKIVDITDDQMSNHYDQKDVYEEFGSWIAEYNEAVIT